MATIGTANRGERNESEDEERNECDDVCRGGGNDLSCLKPCEKSDSEQP